MIVQLFMFTLYHFQTTKQFSSSEIQDLPTSFPPARLAHSPSSEVGLKVMEVDLKVITFVQPSLMHTPRSRTRVIHAGTNTVEWKTTVRTDMWLLSECNMLYFFF